MFSTPVPTEIPTDSFMEDYELEEMQNIDVDLQLEDLDEINKQTGKRVKISTGSSSRAGKKRKQLGYRQRSNPKSRKLTQDVPSKNK